jgi:hypothetical protein
MNNLNENQNTVNTGESLARGDGDRELSDGLLVNSSISQQNPLDPVYEYEFYKVSLRVKRPKIPITFRHQLPDRTGTTLDGFSDKSRSRLRFVSANSSDVIQTQFCMTYGDVWPINGKSLKSDLIPVLLISTASELFQ